MNLDDCHNQIYMHKRTGELVYLELCLCDWSPFVKGMFWKLYIWSEDFIKASFDPDKELKELKRFLTKYEYVGDL